LFDIYVNFILHLLWPLHVIGAYDDDDDDDITYIAAHCDDV